MKNCEPRCVFIAHSDWWKQVGDGTCERLLQTHSNLNADISCTVGRSMIGRDKSFAGDFFVRNADTLLFGTDRGWWSFGMPPAPEFSSMNQPDLPTEVQVKMVRRNAGNLLWNDKTDNTARP